MSSKPQKLNLKEFIGFTVFALALKAVLDLVIWKYAGPISLVIVLVCLAVYLRSQGKGLDKIGLVRFQAVKSYWLFPLQTVLAFIVIIATGALVTIVGEASGLAFMQPDREGALSRFGDLAGNTPLFLFWLAILWVAGPAEELFFRGFMINALSDVLGRSWVANTLSILIPALIFARRTHVLSGCERPLHNRPHRRIARLSVPGVQTQCLAAYDRACRRKLAGVYASISGN